MAAYPVQLKMGAGMGTGGEVASNVGMVANNGKKEERIPQWGYQETKDFIAIRSELEKDFTQTKRNKSLWEIIASKMKERGHRRSADQCKCKWKNLYNRYKAMVISQGFETTDLENGRPCPFYDELHAIFSDPDKSPDGLLMDSGMKRSRKQDVGERFSEDPSDEDDVEYADIEVERMVKESNKKLRKGGARDSSRLSGEKCMANTMQEVLEDFFQQQQRTELEWMGAVQRREEERRRREEEWRQAMEKLEHERNVREQMWREREEQRRAREELRAQKRDALFSALLSRLADEN